MSIRGKNIARGYLPKPNLQFSRPASPVAAAEAEEIVMKHVVILVELKFTVLVSVFGGYHTALISDTTVVRPVILDLKE